jgi:hypothetical protein
VCVRQTDKQQAKLDHHHFDGIFIGYTATNQNIQYIDVTSGVVKRLHHAVFDEAWYLQPSQPPAAQLLYNLGLEDESPICVTVNDPTIALYPPTPCLTAKGPNKVHVAACHIPLPLQESGLPITYGA